MNAPFAIGDYVQLKDQSRYGGAWSGVAKVAHVMAISDIWYVETMHGERMVMLKADHLELVHRPSTDTDAPTGGALIWVLISALVLIGIATHSCAAGGF